MSNFAIGSTNFNRAGRFSNKWHKLDTGDNYYRILPPLFSLASEGRYSMFWAFHGGFKNSEGVTQMFKCVETKDKNRLIKQHCSICDLVTAMDSHYKLLQEAQKAGQATEEQVKKFWNEEIFPIKAQKVFFVNAVSRDGEVGVLQLPYKAHQAVDEALKSCAEKNGIDPTGVEGAWINIKKVQPFKGSPQVSYGAEVVFEPTGNGSYQIKRHVLDQNFIENQLKTGAKDLKTLFREISPEDVTALASVDRTQRPAIVDRIFARKEQPSDQSASGPLNAAVPGTTAVLQGRVVNTPDGGIGVQMPAAPAPTPQNLTPFTAPVAPPPVFNPPSAPTTVVNTPNFAPPAFTPPAPSFTPPPATPGNPFAFPGNTAPPAAQTTGFMAPVAPPPAPPAFTPPAPAPGGIPMGASNLGQPPVAQITSDEFRNIFGGGK